MVMNISRLLSVGLLPLGNLESMTAVGRLGTVTNGRFQELEFNDLFPAMNLKKRRPTGSGRLVMSQVLFWPLVDSK